MWRRAYFIIKGRDVFTKNSLNSHCSTMKLMITIHIGVLEFPKIFFTQNYCFLSIFFSNSNGMKIKYITENGLKIILKREKKAKKKKDSANNINSWCQNIKFMTGIIFQQDRRIWTGKWFSLKNNWVHFCEIIYLRNEAIYQPIVLYKLDRV